MVVTDLLDVALSVTVVLTDLLDVALSVTEVITELLGCYPASYHGSHSGSDGNDTVVPNTTSVLHIL